MKKCFLFHLLFFLFFYPQLSAQTISGVINTYTKVTALTNPGCECGDIAPACLNDITVSSVVGFSIGDKVMIIQMKGATVNTTNTASAGTVTAIGNAGNYELFTIGDITGSVITTKAPLGRTYDVAGLVQLVHVPEYTDVTVSGTLTASAWNPTTGTGGVLALVATGTVTLNANVDVTGLGYAGIDITVNGSPDDCSISPAAQYVQAASSGGSAVEKGNGIVVDDVSTNHGRGPRANGGGGGVAGDSGGGGGSNYGAGGVGGDRWCDLLTTAGGLGGLDLSSYIELNKLFMGGAGGAGFTTSGNPSSAADGGGVVLIKANSLVGNANSILAAGTSPNVLTPSGPADGGGGGGGGGAVALLLNSFSGTMTVNVSGGNGQTLNTETLHGPGGGGGGGVLFHTLSSLPGGITVNSAGGSAGTHTGAQSANTHGATNGSSGGIIQNFELGGFCDDDGDGTIDVNDIDEDNDGISDYVEVCGSGATSFVCAANVGGGDPSEDTDLDGIPNYADSDYCTLNAAGVCSYLDTDSDGVPDFQDLDTDNDGIPDIIESGGIDMNGDGRVDNINGSGVLTTDVDKDGLDDAYDNVGGAVTSGNAMPVKDSDGDGRLDHLDLDADQDGIPDIIEAGGVDTDGDGRTNASTDSDADGLVDIYDSDAADGPGGTGTNGSALVQTNGTDTDADGLADDAAIVWEHGNGTDIDADGDGLPEFIDLDSDQDGIPDVVEAGGVDANGDGHPDVSTDVDGDGLIDIFDSNASDGLAGNGTNGVALVQTNGTDTGSDGLADGDSGVGYQHGGSVADIDTDGDNIQDWLDIDADNDGVPDVIEAGGVDADGNGYADPSTDTDNDGLVDAYDSNASDGPGSNGTNGVALVQTGGTDTGSDGLADGDATVTFINGSSSIWPDWDGDGVPNHLDLDADNDGIADIIESGGVDSDRNGIVDGTFTDGDGDGFSNTFDGNNGGTAIITTGADIGSDNLPDSYSDDIDADVHPNFLDVDADDDGLLDNLEAQTTSGYTAAGSTDSDGDGILNEYDGGNLLVPTNTDSGGEADYLDTDSDDDGLLDKNEAWDGYTDGDASSDLTCSADADDDGLLDCYDNNSADITDMTVGTTPPDDNGFDGTGFTNSQSSTGTTAEDVYPNNGGAEPQPDWRDNNNCALSPSLVYPITGTGYLFSGGTHSSSSATTGTIRSTNFCEDAISAGYTYYYPAIESDKLLFSIDHSTNSNTTTVDYVELRREEAANRQATSGSQGFFVMGRDWFVQTINNDPLTGNVNVRFYFDQADSIAMSTLANSFAADKSGTAEAPKWFKVNDAWTNGDIAASTGLSTLTGYTELVGTYGTEGGLHYVQFNNITGFSGGGLIQEVSGTLPLELGEFSASSQGFDALLSWSTLQEQNTDAFYVERSIDKINFEEIGKVQAAGESRSLKRYSFTDRNVQLQNEQQWIYRLRMQDLDGSFTYSHTVEVSRDESKAVYLDLYPNPAGNHLEIVYRGANRSEIVVYNMKGQKIYLNSLDMTDNKGTLSLDLTTWVKGVYLIQLRTNSGLKQLHFIKE